MIGVTGASGHLGGAVVRILKDQVPAKRIRALARDPASVKALGVPAKACDYDKPRGLAKAFSGVETLLLVSTWDFDRRMDQHRNVIAAAQAAGVGHVVYASAMSPGAQDHLTGAHPQTEALLAASGLHWTALRASLYMSLFDSDIRSAARLGEHVTSLGKAKAALIDRWDLARADAAVLLDPGPHAGQAYDITGPTAVTAQDFADTAADLAGSPVKLRNLTRAGTEAALRRRGLSERDVDVTLGLEDKIRTGYIAKVSPDLQRLVGDSGSMFPDTMRRRLAA